MSLHIIGLGMQDEKSVTVKGLEQIKDADVLYLETYTSKLTHATIADLEQYYGKSIIPADREVVEKQAEVTILKDAAEKKTCFLVIGDPFSATTHMDLYNRAMERGIETSVIGNVSVLTAIGIVGLELYKYGKVTSIPFDHENVTTPYDVFVKNKEMGMHTLFLLDLRPEEEKYMTCREAVNFLIERGLDDDETVVCCAHLGSDHAIVKVCKARDVPVISETPQCLIIPGNLHFVEEEFLEKYSK